MTMSEYDPQPSIVVGVGQAGTAVLSSVADLIDREETNRYFHLIAIDSNKSELEANAPDRAETIHLTHDDGFAEGDLESYPYLRPDMDLSSEGAKRQRPVGRYKLDSRGNPDFSDNFVRLRDAIDDHIRNLVSTTARAENATIYFVNSLGGGTGSGTFPLLATSLSAIANEVEQTRNIPTYTFGIGVTPQLGAEGEFTFRGNPVYYANTYASLRDIETMLEEPSPDKPLSLEIHSEEQQKRSSDQRVAQYLDADRAIELSRAPFDNYFLVGVNEGLIGEPPGRGRMEGYNAVVDNTIAEALYGLSRYEAVENFINGPNIGGFRQSEVAVPIDLLRRYCREKERKAELEASVADDGELTLKKRGVADRIEAIDTVLDSPASVQDVVADEDVRAYVTDELDNRLGRGRAIVENGTDADLQAVVESVGDRYRVEDAPGQRHLVQLFTLERLKSRLDDAAETVKTERADLISAMWENLNMVETEYGDLEEDEGTISAKATAMEPHLRDKIEEYEQLVEEESDGGILNSIFGSDSEAKEWLEYYRNELNSLKQIQDDYRRIRSFRDRHRELRKTVEDDLDDVRDSLVRRRREFRNEIEDTERTIDELRQNIQSLRHDIERPNYEPRLGYLPITNLEEIDSRKLENELTDLAAFIEGNYVSESEFEAAIETQVEDALAEDNPIMSQTVPAGATNTDKYLFWAMYSEEFAASDYAEYVPNPTQFGAGDGSDSAPRIDDPYRVKFVSYLKQGPLEHYDVYRKLNQRATSGRFSDSLPTDRDYRLSFAYVEWYGRDIEEAFQIRQQVSLPVPPELEPERVRGDFDTEDDKMNRIVTNTFDSYLWNGTLADGYNGDGVAFEGWKEKLEPHDISYTNLQKVTPESRQKSKWLDDTIDWEELLEELETNLVDLYETEVNWKYPERDEPDRILND
jgi:hypothetical protein